MSNNKNNKFLKQLSLVSTVMMMSHTVFAENPSDTQGVQFLPAATVNSSAAVEPDVKIFTSHDHYFKRVVTSTKPRTTSSEEFEDIPGASTDIYIPRNWRVLVNTTFSAESRCNEFDSTTGNWCEVRVLVDDIEASPAASNYPGDTFALDSTDGGNNTDASWEGHSMDRHKCVRNYGKSEYRRVPVKVQWKVTNFDGGTAPSFWLDDWSMSVQLSKGCRQKVKSFDAE